mmetsp:Transcript_6260/g.15787  ORF Transcript_6260/g.15787 Transcript_6260/m.15787 type:complete len:466 (+) Transcript_6260:149-1546(+)
MNRLASQLRNRYHNQVAVRHRHRYLQDRCCRHCATAPATNMMMRCRSVSTSTSTSTSNSSPPGATTRTTTRRPSNQRPVVVLAGWLGCHPKSLRRYQEMYESFGFDTKIVVASPVAVVDSTLRMYSDGDNDNDNNNNGKRESGDKNPITMTRRHQQAGGANGSSLMTMDDWAWKVLHDIHKSTILACPNDHSNGNDTNCFFVFHAFSNGGCFVWESVCRIFDMVSINNCHPSSKTNENDETEQHAHFHHPRLRRRRRNNKHGNGFLEHNNDIRIALELSSRCRGVVFDSCPAWFGSPPFKLWMALQHVMGPTERGTAGEGEGKDDVSSLLDGLSSQLGVAKHRITTLDDSTKRRNLQYFDYLRGDSSSLTKPSRNGNSRNSSINDGQRNSIVSSFPQLYLYSKDDRLTDYEYVQSIIDSNRQKGMVVFEQCWMESTHCGHLKEHPNEYRAAVVDFLQVITKKSKL